MHKFQPILFTLQISDAFKGFITITAVIAANRRFFSDVHHSPNELLPFCDFGFILLSIAISLKKCYNKEGDIMPKKREIKIELNAKEEARAHYEMEWGKNESIKRQAAILYYANQGTKTMTEFCQKTGFDPKTVSRMLSLYETMGIEAIYKCQRGKRINHLEQISDELEAYFDKNPPADVPEAVSVIREIFHVNITVTPVRYWLKAKAIRTKSQEVYQQKPI